MNTLEKCDKMTRLVLDIENAKNEKAERNKADNEEINKLEDRLLEVARERTNQMEIPFPKKADGKDKGEKRVASA